MNKILSEDLEIIFNSLSDLEKSKFHSSTILITGCAGFLGYYFINFLVLFKESLKIRNIIGLDNFLIGSPTWLKNLKSTGAIELHNFNITSDNLEDIPGINNVNFVLHMASIASPTFYRIYPIETIDANIWGLRSLLNFFSYKKIKGLLFFSSSEVYGNPDINHIPTSEDYNGDVSSQGPRACYDESKRFGETLCYVFNEKFNMPISIVRPFNNFGPGMKLNDARAPADFAQAIVKNNDIVLHSNGSPTRTFCYISDAITGYLKALIFGKFDTFNIGNPKPEITILDLAKLYEKYGKELLNYSGKVIFKEALDPNYLVNNPQRRAPSIKKANTLLGYNPRVPVDKGVARFLEYLSLSRIEDLIW